MDQPLHRQVPDLLMGQRSATARRWPALSRTDWFLIIVGAIAAITTGTFLVTDGFRRASELTQAQQWEAHSLAVIARAEKTRSAIANMRLGERSYLLTSDESYLKGYLTGRRQSQSAVEQLRVLTRDNREQVATLSRLTVLLQQVGRSLATQIAEQRSGGSADVIASVRSRTGEQTIVAVDAEIDRMIDAETRLLEQRRKALRDADIAAWQNRLALSLLGLAALGAMLWLLFRMLTARSAVVFERERAELAEQLVTRDTQLAEQIEELNALYASAPIGLAFFSRDYRYLRINDELAAINGVPASAHLGRKIRDVLPGDAPNVEPIIDRVFASGETIRDFEVSGETPQQPGVTRHWLTGFYPVRDAGGAVEAVGIWVIEITERKRAEDRETLLAREVDHRAKNLLAVVQSVVQLTQASEPEELKAAIIGRIQALARTHSLLAESRWDGAQIGELVRDELAPYLGGSDDGVTVSGPSLLLRPAAAQSLAMVLHELATNAAKHGALSIPGGRLDVDWSNVNGFLELTWTEMDGPKVATPTRTGFGSRIIRASIERQLHGSLEQDWMTEGLQCTIRISTREALGSSEQQSAA